MTDFHAFLLIAGCCVVTMIAAAYADHLMTLYIQGAFE